MHFDGAILSTWKVEQGHLVRRQHQPNHGQILQFNRELQKNVGAVRDLSFAGWTLQIPENDLYELWKKYPELNSPNGDERTLAWKAFIRSSEADPYRIRPRQRKPRITRGP